jgi:hypothetical protein
MEVKKVTSCGQLLSFSLAKFKPWKHKWTMMKIIRKSEKKPETKNNSHRQLKKNLT